MKKITSIVCVLLLIFSLTACSKPTKYSLISGNLGSTDISNLYEYNYIELNEKNGTYKLENKAKTYGIVTKQTGSYIVDANGIVTITNNEIPANNFLLCKGEIIMIIGDTLYVKGYIVGYGNSSLTFKK